MSEISGMNRPVQTESIQEGLFPLGFMVQQILGYEGSVPKEVQSRFGITQEVFDAYYEMGCHLFDAGRFFESWLFFRFLTKLDPTEYKYIMGMAACCCKRGQYDRAQQIYQAIEVVSPFDPYVNTYIAHCYQRQGKIALARQELKRALGKCLNEPAYQTLEKRIRIALGQADKVEEEVA